jgi:hypothetical protein
MRTRARLATMSLLTAAAALGWAAACSRSSTDARVEDTAHAQVKTADPHGWIGTETVNTRFGNFEFKGGYPTAEAIDKLYDLRTFSRAVESYLHFVTIMSMFHMQKGLHDSGLDAANKFLFFEKMDAQSLYLTPNTETVSR